MSAKNKCFYGDNGSFTLPHNMLCFDYLHDFENFDKYIFVQEKYEYTKADTSDDSHMRKKACVIVNYITLPF